jgi:hypothetical protein
MECCRKEPKSFIQRRPNGNGGYIYNLKGTRLVPYRLPEIIDAQEIIIVEGEKDADNVKALGFTGTTSPMGAKKWRAEFNDYFRNKDIVLIPDNDNEGREHMAQVGASLNGIVKSVKWIDLPDLASKGDISDWIGNFSSKEEAAERLSIMIEAAQTYNPPKTYTLEDVILSSSDYQLINLPEKKTIIHPIVSEQQIILISGWRGIGKSWFAIGLMDAVTRGAYFGPWPIKHCVPCLYLDGEMASQDVKKRIHDLNPAENRKAPLRLF